MVTGGDDAGFARHATPTLARCVPVLASRLRGNFEQ